MGLWKWLFGRSRPAEFARGRGWTIPVVGESHYQSEIGGQYRANGGTEHDLKVTAVLMPEPSNPHDANAVAVLVGGQTVGYLPRDLAAEYGSSVGPVTGWCSAKIIGGFVFEDGTRASYGVKLNLSWPPRFVR